MKVTPTAIPDVKILEPRVFSDERGFFFESYNKNIFYEATGTNTAFVQDNHSKSIKNVLRGLHYQINHSQGKLVRVVTGEVFDVAVDLRKSSLTFGKWVSVHLSEQKHQSLWIPEGFAHGFLTLSPVAELLYKTTDFYDPHSERCLRWDDPTVAIKWPLDGTPILSPKDQQGFFLKQIKDAELFP